MSIRIALIGAGGKMGCRVTDNFLKCSYQVDYVEVSERGLQNLQDRGRARRPGGQGGGRRRMSSFSPCRTS